MRTLLRGFLLSIVCMSAAVLAAETYTVVGLGTLGGTNANATDLNDAGQAVGWSYTSNNSLYHAFLFTDGAMTDLGTLGGANSEAFAINEAGDVVGWAQSSTGQQRAFLYTNGVMTDLGIASPYSIATGINNAGVIVGYAQQPNGRYRGFIFDHGNVTWFGDSNSYTYALAINDAGVVAGYAQSANSVTAPFRYQNGVMTQLGSGYFYQYVYCGHYYTCSRGRGGVARAINSSGTVVGYQYEWDYYYSQYTATRYDGQTGWILSGPSQNYHDAFDINDAGDVVLYKNGVPNVRSGGVDSPLGNGHPRAINEHRWVAGQSSLNGLWQAVIWRPGGQPQSIDFAGLPQKTYGDAPFEVSATATSGLPVSFTATGDCSIDGTTVTLTGAGSCSITASQAGNDIYDAANSETRSFNIAKAAATITLSDLSHTYDGGGQAVVASVDPSDAGTISIGYAQSGLPVVSPTNAGSYDVVASLTSDDYAASDATGVLVIGKAEPSILISGFTLTYDGDAHPASGTATGVDGVDLGALSFTYDGSPAAPVNAGSYAVIGSIGETANHLAGSGTASIDIGQATPTIMVTGGTFTYDGLPHPATGAVTGVNDEPLGAPDLTYDGSTDAPVNAGTYDVVAAFAGNTNYIAGSESTTLTIEKAAATIHVSDATFTYDGSPKGVTVSTTPEGLAGVSITYSGSSELPTNAGTYGVVATLTNGNYAAADATATLTIDKAQSVVTVTGGTWTYDGEAHPATGSVSGVGGTIGTPTFTYNGSSAVPVNAGTYAVVASFEGGANHHAATAEATIEIEKATPLVTVTGGTWIYDAATHAATGSATGVDGSGLGTLAFTYNDSPELPLDAGTYAVVGSVAETANHVAGSATATITIEKADPILTWASPAGIVYGTALGSSQLDATASFQESPLAGVFVYTPAAGTILDAGGAQELSATFTPNDSTNFNAGSITVTIDVAKADQTLEWAMPASIVYGTPLGASQLNATVSVVGPAPAGALAYSPAAGTVLGAGDGQTLTVVAAATNNYNEAYASVTIDVAKAPLSITADDKTKIFGQTNPPFTASYSGFVNGDGPADVIGLQLTTPATQSSTVGLYPILASGATAANYLITLVDGTLTIGPAPTLLAVSPASGQYSDEVTLTATVTPSAIEGQSATGSVQFLVDGSIAGTAPLVGGIASMTYVLDLNPDVAHAITAVYTSTNANFTGSSGGPAALSVSKEDARVTYTGAMFASTESATSSRATVTLSATIRDISAVTGDPAHDTFAGDIRKATITFVQRTASGPLVIGSAPIGLVSAGDLKSGTATFNWTVDIGNADSVTYDVALIVSGYYTRNSTFDDVTVTVSKPLNDSISGGGFIVASESNGLKSADDGTKNNFGFNVKYNKSGKNLQGHLNTTLRRIEADGVVHVYQVKANVMTSLSTDAKSGAAVFNGKANIQDITDPDAPVSVDGNATLQVNTTDRGLSGVDDSIAITVWDKNGGLWFASSWDGTKTVERVLGGGNVVVK